MILLLHYVIIFVMYLHFMSTQTTERMAAWSWLEDWLFCQREICGLWEVCPMRSFPQTILAYWSNFSYTSAHFNVTDGLWTCTPHLSTLQWFQQISGSRQTFWKILLIHKQSVQKFVFKLHSGIYVIPTRNIFLSSWIGFLFPF